MSIVHDTTAVPAGAPVLERRARARPVPAPQAWSSDWLMLYRCVLAVLDAGALVTASVVALQVRFGDSPPPNYSGLALGWGSAAAPLLWVLMIAASRGYEPRFLGMGSEEFKRVSSAALRLTAVLAVLSVAFKVDVTRGFVAIALPLAAVLTLAGRYGARKVLHALRRDGRCLHRVLAVGTAASVEELVARTRREPYAGLVVAAVCLLDDPAPGAAVAGGLGAGLAGLAGTGPRIALVAGLDGVAAALPALGADTVAVTGGLPAPLLRRLAWTLERTGTALVVAPGFTDVAGPRIHVRPVAGLPLLHLEAPELSGGRRLAKGALDRGLAALGLLGLLPLLVAVGLAVRLSSPGPALFRQVRVGRLGREFQVWKFRSMYVEAEARLAGLRPDDHAGLLFKMRADPRVTRLGRTLRRFSLDELPQLVNVLTGSMSLVGPRPPLPSEVQRYGDEVRRRLLVKPGITGLWQVSGRSDLSWEESVRLDLDYVENWSVAVDLMILWKTFFAVVAPRGAY